MKTNSLIGFLLGVIMMLIIFAATRPDNKGTMLVPAPDLYTTKAIRGYLDMEKGTWYIIPANTEVNVRIWNNMITLNDGRQTIKIPRHVYYDWQEQGVLIPIQNKNG